jgi:Ca2+-binding EF-hand superfamily protein
LLHKEFTKLDKDMSGLLDVEELSALAKMLLKETAEYDDLTQDQVEEQKLKIFDEMDMDKSGFVSFHEVKVYLTRKMIAIN